ncbi:hypothetical protein Misp03_17950 [Microbispora sp. NBRC 16548]|nr:hypothetical protein Misp03_17950 [Microbispora sp. NBRC 16548]
MAFVLVIGGVPSREQGRGRRRAQPTGWPLRGPCRETNRAAAQAASARGRTPRGQPGPHECRPRRGLRHVGALLDATHVHGGRSAATHLSALGSWIVYALGPLIAVALAVFVVRRRDV